jgi:hypothetical protein
MNYLKFLLTRKWAVVVVALILLLLTVGLPSYNGEWALHSVREIESGKERFCAILLLVAVASLSLLQVNNEFQRPKK